MKQFILLFLLLLLSISNCAFANDSKPLKVMFLNPGHPTQNATGNFWPNVSYFMQIAADDLNIDLQTIYANRNHILMKSFADEVIKQKPDYAVIVNEKGVADSLVKRITHKQIPVFMLLNTLDELELENLSEFERRYYVGSLTPDNFEAGFKLLNELVNMQKEKYSPKRESIKVLALHGDYTTPASKQRAKGFYKALQQHPNVELLDSTIANWSRQQAYNKVTGILHRGSLDIIWAANDPMACGASTAIKHAKLAQPALVGGINWDDDIPRDKLSVSIGGHVTLGAFAMVMLHDLHHGNLPKAQHHTMLDIFMSNNSPSFNTYMTMLKDKSFAQCDFSQFSNSKAHPVPFSINNLLCQQ